MIDTKRVATVGLALVVVLSMFVATTGTASAQLFGGSDDADAGSNDCGFIDTAVDTYIDLHQYDVVFGAVSDEDAAPCAAFGW